MELLQKLTSIHAPSGNEIAMKNFILDYVAKNKAAWKVQPEIVEGETFQDCLMLVFGKPKVAVFAHMDSIGFTVRYQNRVVKIGGPVSYDGIILVGEDSKGFIECMLMNDTASGELYVKFDREIDRGTELVFKPYWKETEKQVQCCYMDNRLGVWNALKLAETLENGILAFSCWEEHGGGSVGYLGAYMYEKYGVRQALISDITWVTEGVPAGNGVVISMRDKGIPRRRFIDRIIELAKTSGIAFQLEVEGAGSSDGGYLQASALPFDWVFIGAPEANVHSPEETVHKYDIQTMLALYRFLMEQMH